MAREVSLNIKTFKWGNVSKDGLKVLLVLKFNDTLMAEIPSGEK